MLKAVMLGDLPAWRLYLQKTFEKLLKDYATLKRRRKRIVRKR